MQPRLIALASVIVFAAVYRVLPHPPNIAPVAAMALFAGANFKDWKLALFVPLAAMLLSDVIIGFHGSMLFVYLGMALTVAIGWSFRQDQSVKNIAIGALGATAAFFLITNFGAWLGSPMYPQNTAGLMQSYFAGIPFLQYSLIGNSLFSVIFFGALKLVLSAPDQTVV